MRGLSGRPHPGGLEVGAHLAVGTILRVVGKQNSNLSISFQLVAEAILCSGTVGTWHGSGAKGIFGMSKPRVTFTPKRIAEGDWQIEAHYEEAEIRYISGFASKEEIDEWLAGTRKVDWLRSQGYAK
jgi:hypothetical protein